MKALIDEYGKILLYVIISIVLILCAFNVVNTNFSANVNKQVEAYDTVKSDTNIDYTSKTRPVLTVNESIKLNVGDNFDVINTPGVSAKDGTTNENITSKVLVYGDVSGTKYDGSDWVGKQQIKVTNRGVYTLRYSVRDSSGFYVSKKIQVIVEPNAY